MTAEALGGNKKRADAVKHRTSRPMRNRSRSRGRVSVIVSSLFACLSVRMIQTHQPLQTVNLPLLILDSIDQHEIESIVFDAFHLSLTVMCDQDRLDMRDILGGEADIGNRSIPPGKSDRPEAVDDVETAGERC